MKKKNQFELNHFPFYRSYAEALSRLNDKQKISIIDGMINYAFYEKEYSPKDDITSLAWALIKPILDTTIKQVKGGSKGGRPSKAKYVDDRPIEERLKDAENLRALEKQGKSKP